VSLSVRGRKVTVLEAGAAGGAPLVYLHGIADVHGVAPGLQAFHARLSEAAHVIAPAHPGCAGTDELPDGCGIDDVVFHYLEVFDALGLVRFDLVGHCVGGWIAAEIAARHPEKVERLALIGACGLFVPGAPIGDVFMHAQPQRGTDLSTLRKLLFVAADTPSALRFFPDGRGDLDEEVRRYQMLRFGSFVGFKPPYFYSGALGSRLHRAGMPALVVWGETDRMVPRSHGEAYVLGLRRAGALQLVSGAGHAAPMEQPDACADMILRFLRTAHSEPGATEDHAAAAAKQ
jgi:pimeloyl-ACP methyl ester carboxylesterase